jgi:hypothetical protein
VGKAAGAAFKARAAFHAEELKEALAGPHGAVVSKTIVALGAMNINNAGALVAAVEQIDWTDVSAKTRVVLLHQVNAAITELREKRGLPPFDDGPPGTADNAFRRIKAVLFP